MARGLPVGLTVIVIQSGRNTSLLSQLRARELDVHAQHPTPTTLDPGACNLDDTLRSWQYVPSLSKVSATATHWAAMRSGCARSAGRPFLVLEDDALLSYEGLWPADLLTTALSTDGALPRWGAINVGCSNTEYAALPRRAHLVPWRPTHWGIYAVLYNAPIACTVPRSQLVRCAPPDYAMYRCMPSFTAWPPLFGHNYSVQSTVGNGRDATHSRGTRHERNVRAFWQRAAAAFAPSRVEL